MERPLNTVVEIAEFIQAAKRAGVSDQERASIIEHFARNPDDGAPLGGGLFKARIARPGGGKSGGYRTIHFFRSADMPVVLLTLYAKNQKAALSKGEHANWMKLADVLAETFRSRK